LFRRYRLFAYNTNRDYNLVNRKKGVATMGTPKRSKIARESIKSGGGDLRYKKPLDARAQKRSMDKASKKFREM